MEKFNAKTPIYPLLGVIISIATLVLGLVTAKKEYILYFYAALYLLFLCVGYWRACFAMIPIAAVIIGLFAGLTYLTGHNVNNTLYAVNRSLAVCFACIPGLSVSSTLFIRNLQQIHTPKIFTLGMMITVNFFPLFIKEMKQIQEAMKTRGVTSIFNPKVFYRAFLVPLVVRIVNVSDTLAVSVETRGFTTTKSKMTVYNPVKFQTNDAVFAVFFIAIAVFSVIL